MCSLKETAASAVGPHKAKAGSQKEKVSGSSKVCTRAFGIKHILTQGQANRQPSIEVVDDAAQAVGLDPNSLSPPMNVLGIHSGIM